MGWQVTQFVPTKGEVACADVTLIARKDLAGEFRYDIDFLLQTHPSYAHFTRVGCWRNLLWARGGAGETAFAQMEGGVCQGPGRLRRPLNMKAGETARFYILTGCAPSETVWQDTVSRWDTDRELARLRGRKSPLSLSTPSRPLNAMLNVWLPAQTLMGRVLGRTGFYQGGGAIGFRDQLQDMLSLIGIDDARVRDHLLLCAAHQFPSGDVQHWWHPERMGVRTRVSDDKLFLPYVTAQYIRLTGDETVLDISAPYLREVPIPPDQTDWYGDPGVTDETDTLRVHCQRAIDAACRFGDHGLALMGAGDWNDGMNRVGRQGRGESVWLSQFLLVTLRNFMPYAQPSFAERYAHTAEALRAALENTWDGEWYLRAYDDDGRPLGSHARPGGCQIDSLPQTWAVFAGLSHAREAMKAVESRLIDQRHGLIRLLDPPFSHQEKAGYICAYPPGVRENGGQYTHAACWVVMAYARLGLADEAWQALQMIMPYTHAATPAQRQTYRVEPYVLAGDIYATGEYTLSDPATHAHATPTQTGSPAHQADGDEIDISQARSDGAEADTRSAPSETGASEAHTDGVETGADNAPHEPGTSQAHSDGAEAEKVGHSEPDEARMGLLGRGGWTWYTGASSWAQYVTLRELLGFEMKQGRAALHALLPSDWDEVGVTVRLPHTEYRLLCRRHAPGVSLDGKPIPPPPPTLSPDGKPLTPPPGISSDGTPIPACSGHNHALEGSIPLIDDGGRHTAVFPPRNTEENG